MEIEILGIQYDKSTFYRVLMEGYEAYQQKGPYRMCPYGSDQRNGVWAFGARQAERKLSRETAWYNFCMQEGYDYDEDADYPECLEEEYDE